MKDLAKTQGNPVGSPMGLEAWGKNEFSAKDIVIPKILLMQPMSDLVTTQKAKTGDLVDSVSLEIMGNPEKPMKSLIPFHLEKVWMIQKFNGKRYIYEGIERVTPQNESLPYDFEVGQVKYKRIYTMNFYVLVPGKVLPYVVSFASTSSKAGRELGTEMYVKNPMEDMIPPAKKFNLGVTIEKGDDSTYAVKTVQMSEKSSQEELEKAFKWFQTVQKGATKVDDKGDF